MGTLFMALWLSAAGAHQRLPTPRGPVHVWTVPEPTVTVVYVHGFWTDVDQAVEAHHLAQQFSDSGVAAVFIAPEAPSGPGQQVRWPSLEALLTTVEDAVGQKLPDAVIAVGHSGAYRTLQRFTASPRLKAIALLDAFYGVAEPWDQWLKDGGRLLVVGHATARQSAAFCARHGVTVATAPAPSSSALGCWAAPESHMALITSGQWLPRLIAWTASAQPDA